MGSMKNSGCGEAHVACSELRASYWTGRCDGRGELESASLRRCMEWHARWAVAACFPKDEHLEAHVRWARARCVPEGEDVFLTRAPRSARPAANSGTARGEPSGTRTVGGRAAPGPAHQFAEQAHRWQEG